MFGQQTKCTWCERGRRQERVVLGTTPGDDVLTTVLSVGQSPHLLRCHVKTRP